MNAIFNRIEIDQISGIARAWSPDGVVTAELESGKWLPIITDIIKKGSFARITKPGSARWSREPKEFRAIVLRAGLANPYVSEEGWISAEVFDEEVPPEILEAKLDSATVERLDRVRAAMFAALVKAENDVITSAEAGLPPPPAFVPPDAPIQEVKPAKTAKPAPAPTRRRRIHDSKAKCDWANRQLRKDKGLDQWNGVVADADREIFRRLSAASRSGDAAVLAVVRAALGL